MPTQAMALLKVIAVHVSGFCAKASRLNHILIEHIKEIERSLTAKAKDLQLALSKSRRLRSLEQKEPLNRLRKRRKTT